MNIAITFIGVIVIQNNYFKNNDLIMMHNFSFLGNYCQYFDVACAISTQCSIQEEVNLPRK
ncbi:hypothetical protein [Candidatus Regiella endosymbiont of Tuberolachnus salignus]|uniref:hypothetical protein n=1 Tax=Candidatus Regiella endosymbiont of Tuberolachnus salignus TaxID=3077956 RepID=UPI0030D4C378